MITMSLHVGAKVFCQDGYCGNLTTVVLSSAKGRITDLIVETFPTDASPAALRERDRAESSPTESRKSLPRISRAVPVALTDYVDDRGVHLRIDSRELATYPEGAKESARSEMAAA